MTSVPSRRDSLEPELVLDGLRPIRVLIVDDSRLIAEALTFALGSAPTLEPVGYALGGWEGIALTALLDPDVILVGSRLHGLDAPAFTQLVQVVGRQRPVVVLAEPHADDGGEDVLPLDRSTDELVDALTQACARRSRVEDAAPVSVLPPPGAPE